MKTQLIPLESHDDLISVRDRMSWAKTPRILLVWPKSERIALRPLDLKVLQRHAAALGAQLGLVTRHRAIRREAHAQGIPVFKSTGQAQRAPWPERTLHKKRVRRRPRQNLREIREQIRAGKDGWDSRLVVRIGFFTLGVLAVLVLASLFIPRAQITVTPETEVQSVTLPILADPSLNSVFITGSIPSRELQVVVDGEGQSEATGRMPVPESRAEGLVTFRNLTEEPVTIPAGTVLTSTGLPGVRFVTVGTGDLEGGLEATLDLPVESESPGANGNVDAGAIQAIEGNLGLLVTVTNEESTRGGRNRLADAPTERDHTRLREELLTELETQALREMEALLAQDDQLFKDTLNAEDILEETYDPPLGQPGNSLNLSMRVTFTAWYASGDDLTELASTVLNASKPDGFVASEEPMSFEALNEQQTDSKGITHWVTRVSRNLVRQTDENAITTLVQGRSLAIAQAQLKALDTPDPPEIQLIPEWWPWMPLIPFNIIVETR
ncbi:MAG: baseplate J/gp47 family protein [Anaerolineales bacterium]|jgi:hypothetical protein